MSTFNRTEKEMVDNAEILLFSTMDRKWSCRIRPISTIDEWMNRADDILTMGADCDSMGTRVNELQAEYLGLCEKFEAQAHRPADEESEPITEVKESDIEAAKNRYVSLRGIWRKRTRDYLNEMFEAVCAYDASRLNRDEILRLGVTDAQVIFAFMQLRYFSDPLALSQSVSAMMAKARLSAMKP